MTKTVKRSDVQVATATPADLRVAVRRALRRADCSFDELAAQARSGHFNSMRARAASVAIGDLYREPEAAQSFNLSRRSRAFAAEMSNLLNNTICDGPVLSSVISKGPPMRAVVGYKITTKNFDLTGIPITCTGRAPKLHLGLSFRLAPDDAQKYLMVTSSVMVLATGKDVSNDANILLHYDYDREKEDGYPEAHLHVCATL